MSTGQLVILCLAVLVLAAVAAWAVVAVAKDATASRVVMAREQAAFARAREAEARRETERDAAADLAPARVGHRVTVHTKQPDDQTIFGVLVGDYADRIALEDAEYVTALGVKALPGVQHIATSDISWLDVHALVTLPDHAPAPVAAPVKA